MTRKLLLAAAAALVAGSTFAQGVEIYGRLNMTVERQKAGGESSSAMVNNSSRIGVRGSEDLGGGLKAGFVLEHGFAADTGAAATTFWGRQSEVNLSGSFGTVRLGNFTSEAYYATADYVSMHNHDTGTSADAFYADARLWQQSDKIGYASPSFGGIVLHAAVNTRDLGQPDRTYELAANYDAGALHLGAGYQKTGDANQFAVRGLYEMGAFTLGGYVQRDEDVYAAGSRTTLRLSGMYTMGANELHLNFGRAGDYGKVSDSSATQYTLGFNHNLSKRSKVYAFYTKIDDSAAGVYGGDFNSIAVGLRHNF
ncbi:MAG: porin [Burkholderiales bacterium]|nr:porin [Burkholderiales bacterium]